MDTRSTLKVIVIFMLACLLSASLALRVGPVSADDGGDASPTPTFTDTPDPLTTTEEVIPPTASETETPTETPSSTPTPVTVTKQPPTFTPAPFIEGNYVSNEVLVRFKSRASMDEINGCLKQINGQIVASIDAIKYTVVRMDTVSVSNAVASLAACGVVRNVEPNYKAYIADTIPSDADWSNQYGLVNIRAPQGWDYTTGSSNITIAIVDTGVDLGHPDLAAKIVAGYDFVNNDAVAQDDNGHGTHVAGIAAAVSNNGTGVAGVSWGARIMPVKVLNASGGGSFANVAQGIIWATDHGAQVINLSLGGAAPPASPPPTALQLAVDYAVNNGVVVTAASGNSGMNFVLYPAHYTNVIAVGSTDASNNILLTSNYGPEMDLTAPGANIYSTYPGGGYATLTGTSMSTGYVSGFAALLLGIPGSNSSSVELLMKSTALDLGSPGWDSYYGYGLIQMDAAIKAIWPKPVPPAVPFQPGSNLNNGQSPGWGIQYFPTNTPSLTPTITMTLGSSTPQTPTLTLVPLSGADTPTPEVAALGTETPKAGASYREWWLPCCGGMLILFGILLILFARRRKEPERSAMFGQYISRYR